MKIYREKRNGDLIMMPELVMELGHDFIKKEEKIQKKKSNTFLNRVILFIECIILKNRIKKLDYKNIINKNKEILNGKPVIKGTRITPKVIYEYFIANCGDDEKNLDNFVELIKKEYPSLKNKNEETILKSLLYYIANEPIINIIKTTKK